MSKSNHYRGVHLTNSTPELLLVFLGAIIVSSSMRLDSSSLLSCTLADLFTSENIINGASCAFVWYLLVSFYYRFLHQNQSNTFTTGNSMVATARPSLKPRTEEAIWQGSVHESGHVLTLAILPEQLIPDVLDLRVDKVTERKSGSRGRLHYEYKSGEEPADLEFRRWLLVCFRAGNVAEKMLIGKEYMMSGNDYHQWELLARNYCLHQEVPYFAFPQSESEALVNSKTLNELAREIDRALHIFFEANFDLLLEMAKELKMVNDLSKEELLKVRSKVVLTNNQWI